MNKICVGVLFLFIGYGSFAQNTRDVESPKQRRAVYQSSKEKKGLFKKNKTQNTNEVAEFRAKLRKVYKKKAKEEKLAKKPQYSDPSYFGHKRPPKKRPVGKRKFCKVCKIKH